MPVGVRICNNIVQRKIVSNLIVRIVKSMINKNMEVTSLIFKEVRQPKLPQRSDEATLFFDGKSLQFINYKGKRNSLGSILQEIFLEIDYN